MRLLVVDDDPGLLELIRVTFEGIDVEVREAQNARGAREAVAAAPPDVIVLDVLLRGESGLDLCRDLKSDAATASIPIVVLSGTHDLARGAAAARADAYLPKPFSPLHLLATVERLTGGAATFPLAEVPHARARGDAQLLLYARDLRRAVELERAQRRLLEESYGATVTALAEALASKDGGTRAHSRRVQQYALELVREVEPDLAADVTVGYGFVLHDIGKIGMPDHILAKNGPLTAEERRVMEQHPVLGYDMLRNVRFLRGEGLSVVRSHHERWDGGGYPDGLGGTDIPLAARVFAVVDTLDAMTTDRPYRCARPWVDAVAEIEREAGAQFDPGVVDAFRSCEPRLYELRRALAA